MTAIRGRSLGAETSVRGSGRAAKGRPQTAAPMRRARGRESVLQCRYQLVSEDVQSLRAEARETVRHLLPPAQRLLYIATFYGLLQAQRDATYLIGRLESLARRHGVER